MSKQRSDTNALAAFATLVSALGGGGDSGALMPESDAADFRAGATHIPSEVTLARRNGETVHFFAKGGREHWYWLMPGGRRIHHG